MKQAFGMMQEGELRVSVDGRSGSREMNDLALNFNSMAAQLGTMCESLESQVAARTADLQEANALLERQRDSLDALGKQLAQESNFKSELLSMINHELRTPLTAIITLAQVSRESCDAERHSESYLWEEVENNGKVLLEMINNMLDMARSDAGKMTAQIEPMDVGDIIKSVRRTMMPLAQKYQVGFTTRVAPDAPLVKGDFEKTKRILENLVSNAIKFTPDGGHISIIAGKRFDGSTCISVADDGIGIALADQERVFEKFVQVDSTSTRKYNGSGLGLALVKQYASVQGYDIELTSGLDKGSTFVLVIPANLDVDMEGYGKAMDKVLLIDDEKAMHVAIKELLTKHGYTFCGAFDAESGLTRLEAEKPDLLLLDIMLPGTNGFDLCHTIRAEQGRHIPIIFLSAKNDIVDKSIGFRAGGDDYVTKPFDAMELLLRIEANIRRHKENLDAARQTRPARGGTLRVGELEINLDARKVSKSGAPVTTTAKEFEILAYLAENANKVITRSQIQEHVWGKDDTGIQMSSITVFVRKIREKIEVNPSEPTYLVTAQRVGYMLTDGSPAGDGTA